MRALNIALAAVCVLAFGTAAAAPAAGTASIVAGAVTAVAITGETRVLQKDDAVYSGDRIITSGNGYVRLGLLDGGSMVLRPNTEFAIESFRFQPGVVESAVKVVQAKAEPTSVPELKVTQASSAGSGNEAFFRLVRGGFRAISGLVGKINREEYAVRTPVATIGIRGTVFWSVTCDAVCAADSVVQGGVPAGETALGGTVSAVDQGSVVITSSAGNVATVQSSQVLFTTASGFHVLLPAVPGFLSSEEWLKAAQQAATAPEAAPAAASSSLANAALSTVPTVATLATAVLVGIVAITTDAQDGGDNTTTTPVTTTTSTR